MPEEEKNVALEIKCRDIGNEGCNWKAVANTQDRRVDYVAVLARDVHNVTEFGEDMRVKVKNSLKPWSG